MMGGRALHWRPVAWLAVVLIAFTACGTTESSGGGGERQGEANEVTLILDFLPNPVHAPIYEALEQGYYEEKGIQLAVQTPTSTADTLKLMAAGKADVGIVSLLDFLTSYSQGEPITIVAALEQRPLGSILTLERSGVTRPRDLEGRLVGVTGVPSDLAAVRSMVAYDGGNPDRVRTVTIGFNAVQNLLSGKVDAAVGFWNAEGVQLQAEEPTRIFRLDEYGAPPYPELVVFVRNETLQDRRDLIERFVEATRRGYQDVAADPEAALQALLERAEGITLKQAKPQLEALLPVFQADAACYGYVDLGVLEAYLEWAREAGILQVDADPSDFATDEFTKNC
jgi:NitT/TauT family transport system substrate-binding protein/putative hydroxymethylpyrimidine transport system substrate-binding protein